MEKIHSDLFKDPELETKQNRTAGICGSSMLGATYCCSGGVCFDAIDIGL